MRIFVKNFPVSNFSGMHRAVGSRFDRSQQIVEKLKQNIFHKFPKHPFEKPEIKGNEKLFLRNYLAMSEAFPYLQAGSQTQMIFDCMNRNISASEAMQKTAVVANFLCWDESGGNHLLLNQGMSSLHSILETKKHFHANLLKKDLQALFGEEIDPDYSPATIKYLKTLYKDLGDLDSINRSAAMVGFEMHADRMISALWNFVSHRFNVDKNFLKYFEIHVGGDDPAEEYHVKLTQRLIRDIVKEKEVPIFIKKVEESYSKNIAWCKAITGLKSEERSKKVRR